MVEYVIQTKATPLGIELNFWLGMACLVGLYGGLVLISFEGLYVKGRLPFFSKIILSLLAGLGGVTLWFLLQAGIHAHTILV